jgi:hypothetical protein
MHLRNAAVLRQTLQNGRGSAGLPLAPKPAKRSSTAASINFVKPVTPASITIQLSTGLPENNVHHPQPSISEIARDFPGSDLRLLPISHCLSVKWDLHSRVISKLPI